MSHLANRACRYNSHDQALHHAQRNTPSENHTTKLQRNTAPGNSHVHAAMIISVVIV